MDKTGQARSVGARIRAARLAAGYGNAAEFARAAGIGANSLYRWEAGRIVPDIFSLARVAKVAGVSMEWLALGQDEGSTAAREAFERWRVTPRGKTASEAAMRFLERLPLDGRVPSPAFYDVVLVAFESSLAARCLGSR